MKRKIKNTKYQVFKTLVTVAILATLVTVHVLRAKTEKIDTADTADTKIVMTNNTSTERTYFLTEYEAYDEEENKYGLSDEQLEVARKLSNYRPAYVDDEDITSYNEQEILKCLYNASLAYYDGDIDKVLVSPSWRTKEYGVTFDRAALAVKNFIKPEVTNKDSKVFFVYTDYGKVNTYSETEFAYMINA